MGLLYRAQHQLGIPQLEILTVKVDPFTGPQQAHGFQALQVTAHPGTSRHAEIVVLLVAVAQRGGQREVAAGDHVHGRYALRQVDGMVQRDQQGRYQTHASRLSGDAGQQRHGLQLLVGIGKVVLALVHHVEPKVAGRAHVGADVGEGLLHIGAGGLLRHGRKGDSKLH